MPNGTYGGVRGGLVSTYSIAFHILKVGYDGYMGRASEKRKDKYKDKMNTGKLR